MTNGRAILLVLALTLAGCTGNAVARQDRPVSIQEYKIVAPPRSVYERLYERMNSCRAVHNLVMPADIVGHMDTYGTRGRLFVARGGRTLWGAEFEAIPEGTKLTTQIGSEASSDRFHTLLRGWAEGRPTRAPTFADC
jgi:hypothetical protein